ncbi:hypothetical protein [Desulfotomaculum copahuensis]|uniref:hypothetical protein n=1 Tax=Desulfotomaculum copahuensis TaxID=1838280 RepID=UPI000AC75911|nr:hypothetical protein [Desulfotomaculum copahuensis]
MWQEFARLHNAGDVRIKEWVAAHGLLGLCPDAPGGSWYYRGFAPLEPWKPRKAGEQTKWLFFRWANSAPPDVNVPLHIEETPEMVRLEARKLRVAAGFYGLCLEARKGTTGPLLEEIRRCSEEFYALFPEEDAWYSHYGINDETIALKLPFWGSFFTGILRRVSVAFDDKTATLEYGTPCLLAEIWKEFIISLTVSSNAPRFCTGCGNVFIPGRPWGRFCTHCGSAARRREWRRAQAAGKPPKKRGRPPGSAKNKKSKEV